MNFERRAPFGENSKSRRIAAIAGKRLETAVMWAIWLQRSASCLFGLLRVELDFVLNMECAGADELGVDQGGAGVGG